MLGPAKVIQSILVEDTSDQDVDADDFVLSDPGLFDEEEEVPLWLTSSLATLLDVEDEDLSRRIVAQRGSAKEVAKASIVVNARLLSQAELRESPIEDDSPGAEACLVTILIRQPREEAQNDEDKEELIEAISQRIMQLICSDIRSGVMGLSPDLPVPKGLGIMPTDSEDPNLDSYFKCYWMGANAEQNTIQESHLFRCAYRRIHLPNPNS
jgi:hypothetical protein